MGNLGRFHSGVPKCLIDPTISVLNALFGVHLYVILVNVENGSRIQF